MQGWWRFRRRNTELDDLISAYVEGRTEAAEEARLRQHLADRPAKLDDIDSLRATVALLHTVAPAKAPRSFALQEAPEPAPRPVIRYQWAPAMASAAAAVIVGLLVLGDVTGMLTQTGAPPPAAQPASGRAVEAPGVSVTRQVEAETVVEKEIAPASAEAPLMMKAVEAAPVEAAPVEAAALDVAPPLPQLAGAPAPRVAEEDAAPPPEVLSARAPEEAEAAVQEASRAPILDATPSPPALVAPALGETAMGAGGIVVEPAAEDGLSLPVRQLEIAFGAAAAVLAAAAWLLLRRRRRRL